MAVEKQHGLKRFAATQLLKDASEDRAELLG